MASIASRVVLALAVHGVVYVAAVSRSMKESKVQEVQAGMERPFFIFLIPDHTVPPGSGFSRFQDARISTTSLFVPPQAPARPCVVFCARMLCSALRFPECFRVLTH